VVVKTYTFFSGGIPVLREQSVTVDFFSTVSSARLNWTSSGVFSNLSFNGKVVGTNGSGSVSVDILSGRKNTVRFGVGDLIVNLVVTLTVEGVLCDYNIMYAQNTNAANSFKAGRVSRADFENWTRFQNAIAQDMQAAGIITSSQYATLTKILSDALGYGLPSGGESGSGSGDGNGLGNGGGGSGDGFWGWLFGNDSNNNNGGGGFGVGGVRGFFSVRNVALIIVVLVVVVGLFVWLRRRGG